MAKLVAQQSVNTRDLPELALIKGGTQIDGLVLYEPNFAKYKFGGTEVDLLSTVQGYTGDIVTSGSQVTSGTIRQVDVRGAGDAPKYTITGLEFQIVTLFTDAGGNGRLDDLPTLIFDDNEELNGSPFADVLFAFGSDDILKGNDGNDELNGGKNHDELTGGRGADKLTGGEDFDTFIFLALTDSTKGKGGRDTILDFTPGDKIDLSAIDAKRGDTKPDAEFKFIKKQEFHDKEGELRYKVKKGDALVQADVNGDGKADFSILVDGVSKLKSIDFEL